jgi:hypothetical protein
MDLQIVWRKAVTKTGILKRSTLITKCGALLLKAHLFLSLKVFFQGDSKDCRLRVQTLNNLKGEREKTFDTKLVEIGQKRSEFQQMNSNQFNPMLTNTSCAYNQPRTSKWAKYLTKDDLENYSKNEEEDDEEYN